MEKIDNLDIHNYIEFHSNELEITECGKETSSPTKHIGPYVQDVYMIYCCVEGRGSYICNGKNREISAGDMFLIRPTDIVEYYPNSLCPWTYLWVSFKGNAVSEILKKTVYADKYVIRKTSSETQNYFYQMVDDYNLRGTINYKTMGYLYLIFGEIEAARKESVMRSQDKYVREAIKYIVYNLENDVTIEVIAQSLNIAPNYLINVFTEVMGISPIKYLANCRLDRAHELLKQNKSVADVYRKCGYSKKETFVKAFKRKYGYLPKRVLGKKN